jgi:geranylgeranyl reductase family protein
MDIETDVLIVGGGPAGVIAAYTSAKLGMKTILADAKTYEEIGNKTCGDALDLKAPTYLKEKIGIEMPNGKEVSDIVEYLVIQTEKNEIPVQGDGFVVDRHIYGHRLLKMAESVGVQILPQRKALKGLFSDDYVIGASFKNLETQKEENIKAKITIDCSGRNYIIRKTMPEGKFPRLEHTHGPHEIVASFREIIKLKEDHPYHKKIYLMYDKRVPEPGYFWFFSKGPFELNAGIGWKLSMEGKGSNMRKIYKDVLHKYYPEGTYEVIDAAGYTIPTRYPLLNQVANGFITAGDAAFHVDPFTAEGHGPALMAGYLAGKYASDAIKSGDLSEKKLWGYNKDTFDAFGTGHCKNQVFTEVLQSLKINGMDFILGRKIMTTKEFGDLNRGIKPSTFSMLKKVIKMTPRYDYLFKLRTLSNSTTKIDKFFANYPKSPDEYEEWFNKFYPWFNKVILSFGNYPGLTSMSS